MLSVVTYTRLVQSDSHQHSIMNKEGAHEVSSLSEKLLTANECERKANNTYYVYLVIKN